MMINIPRAHSACTTDKERAFLRLLVAEQEGVLHTNVIGHETGSVGMNWHDWDKFQERLYEKGFTLEENSSRFTLREQNKED